MIIILKGADASANNLGSVEVPIDWDVDAAAALTHMPTAAAAFTYAKNKAFNTFFKGLKTAGIYSKTTHIFLPCLGRVEGGVNLVAPTYNINFPTANATYGVKGVYFSLGWITPFTKNLKDSHVGVYTSTATSDVTPARYSMASSASNFEHLLGRRINSARSGFAVKGSSELVTTNSGHMQSIGPMIGSVKESINTANAVIDSELITITTTYTAGPTVALILGGSINNSATSFADCYHSLFTFGSYLTQTELAAYSALQTSLMTALLAV